VDDELTQRLERSGYARPGFAERYDRYRPRPPHALLELLPPLAGTDRLRLVVDLGSGTGLSTRFWAERADEVVGVEPNDAMRAVAERATTAPSVRYVGASSYATGLPAACADLVTAAQSLQWMRPERVFPEVGRVLRPGGLFCAYEYVALQTPLWEPEAAWADVRTRTGELRRRRSHGAGGERWPVSRERLEASGVFRHVRELNLHSVEQGDGERLAGLALSEGSLTTLLEAGATEAEVGLDRLRAAAATMRDPMPWWIAYHVWIGLKGA
jgi:SAM-dependent methyltransferase